MLEASAYRPRASRAAHDRLKPAPTNRHQQEPFAYYATAEGGVTLIRKRFSTACQLIFEKNASMYFGRSAGAKSRRKACSHTSITRIGMKPETFPISCRVIQRFEISPVLGSWQQIAQPTPRI